jgi:hypothetical protein
MTAKFRRISLALLSRRGLLPVTTRRGSGPGRVRSLRAMGAYNSRGLVARGIRRDAEFNRLEACATPRHTDTLCARFAPVGTPCYGVPETQRSAGVSESPARSDGPALRWPSRTSQRDVPTTVGTPRCGVPETQRSAGVSESPARCDGPALRWPPRTS